MPPELCSEYGKALSRGTPRLASSLTFRASGVSSAVPGGVLLLRWYGDAPMLRSPWLEPLPEYMVGQERHIERLEPVLGQHLSRVGRHVEDALVGPLLQND